MPPDAVIVRREQLNRLHDRLYELEAALDDVEADLGEDRSAQSVEAAFTHLHEVASRLRSFVVEPVTG